MGHALQLCCLSNYVYADSFGLYVTASMNSELAMIIGVTYTTSALVVLDLYQLYQQQSDL